MSRNYDVCVIGCGVAGTFAALRISEKHSNIKTLVIDIGRPPMKRRRQLEGFLGCFPVGDGKIYPGDLDLVKDIVDGRKAAPAFKWVMNQLSEVNSMKLIKAPMPTAVVRKKIDNIGFDAQYHDYYQWKPKSVHALSKVISEKIENIPNLDFLFDTVVHSVRKVNNNLFKVLTDEGDMFAERVIVCVGRSGWRWVTNLYDDLGIVSNDDYAEYGVRIEVSSGVMAGFNRSHMTITGEDITIGPLCWNGSVIQEDHSDLVISAFRSNEDRWKSDKVSFSLLKSVYYHDEGSVQTDRIGKLVCLLVNDRVSREKVRVFMKGNSQLNLIPEFKWLKEEIERLEDLCPNIIKKGYFHVPDINPKPAEVLVGPNLETEIEGMFVAGESAGVKGIAAAAIMGTIAADSACK
jgi:uncharacterized FAD-dependent dehydrogenase